jgi:serine/threonine protein kinase/tetratricopeptide (TPR) repeat protein
MLAVGTSLGPYKILAPLGAGGMGEVYRAHDTRLGRDVAIKVLSAHPAATPELRARFEREARSIAQLSHPHICTLFDIGREGETDYLVMELLEGETLARRLEKGAMPVGDVLRLGGEIASALDAAHRAGVVHRDLKPGNVMLTKAGAKLMDFGLARAVGVSAAPTALTESPTVSRPLTAEGTIVGTFQYMAPEQLEGKEADARADLWALGCVLYEMATGQRAFAGESQASLIAAILKEEPRPITELKPLTPPALERIATRCLEKDPEERFQSARDLAFALESVSGSTVRPTPVAESPRVPSLAVLPFANLSADKENEYFSDGLAEDIIDALTQVPGLRVMARTSAFAFRGKEADVREIGARLNVEHILEGSVRRAGNRIRVTTQLVKASDGYHLWSQRFDREMTDVFAIQDEISQAIVEKLRVRLTGDRPLVKRPTENLAAYDLCLKARYHLLKMTQEGREAGRKYCEQAIALDPNYALAYVVLAESYFWSAFWGSTDPREAFARAKSAALEALRLDDTIADAHSALGTVLGSGEFDWHGAEREFCRALELSPSSAVVRYDYAWCYAMWFLYPLGRVEQALTEMRRALELDPLDPFYNSLLGHLLHATRQFEPAVAQLQHAINLDPTFFFSYWFLSIVYVLNGRLDEAIAAAEKANALSGGNALTLGALGSICGRAGRTAEARQVLEELTARRRLTYVPASALAFLHAGLGDQDEARKWIARGIEERDPIVVTALKSAPTYDVTRSHAAYPALLRKMNLEP